MKAVRVSDQVIELCDVPDPKGEGVLVNVEAVGICGSDLHLIDSNEKKAIKKIEDILNKYKKL
mgnify:CR=1 FL=1